MCPAFVSSSASSLFTPSPAHHSSLTSLSNNGFTSPMVRRTNNRRVQENINSWMMKIGILFSTVTGNTDEVAQLVKEKLGDEADDPKEISDVNEELINSYDALIVGAPTWNTGADTERSGTSWDEFIYDDLEGMQLNNKPVAIFGLGDADGYGDNFCDAMDELHTAFQKSGAKMIGYTSSDAIDFEESKSVNADGKFIGLPLDNANSPDDTEGRVSDWCNQVLKEAGIPAAV